MLNEFHVPKIINQAVRSCRRCREDQVRLKELKSTVFIRQLHLLMRLRSSFPSLGQVSENQLEKEDERRAARKRIQAQRSIKVSEI
jgi:hypothetical protein